MNPESRVIARDRFCHSFHCLLEVLITRIDVEPLLQDVMRRQLRELLDDRGVMRMLSTDQNAMPLPPPRLGWFDQDHHLAAEQVDGQSAEHPLGEEAGMLLEDLKDPFVVEGSHRRLRRSASLPLYTIPRSGSFTVRNYSLKKRTSIRGERAHLQCDARIACAVQPERAEELERAARH
jgi:hypothetical protein